MILLASSYDQSRFLKAGDLAGEKKFRIREVTEEMIGADKEKKQKLIVWFTNDKRGLVLNITNNRTIRGAFGDVCEQWAGKIIILYPTMVDMRGKMTPALRVRIPPPKEVAAGDGHAATGPAAAVTPPKQPPKPAAEELDEFGQPQSPRKPELAGETDDEIAF